MMRNISVRLDKSVLKEAEKLARLGKVDQSAVLREALAKGLDEVKLKTAIELFSREKASTSEAAEIAGLSVGEFMDELMKRGIRQNITAEDLKNGLENAIRAIR